MDSTKADKQHRPSGEQEQTRQARVHRSIYLEQAVYDRLGEAYKTTSPSIPSSASLTARKRILTPNIQPEDTSNGLTEMADVRQFLGLFCHPFRHRDVLRSRECYNRDGTKQEHWSLPGEMQRNAVICPRFVIFFTAPLHVYLLFY